MDTKRLNLGTVRLFDTTSTMRLMSEACSLLFLPSLMKCFDESTMSTLSSSRFAQHHHDGGDARTEENIRRKADNRLNMVVFNQVLTNLAFLAAAEQHTVRQNDGHDAIGTQMVQVMEQERIIRLDFGAMP